MANSKEAVRTQCKSHSFRMRFWAAKMPLSASCFVTGSENIAEPREPFLVVT
jgi:hypothetical protein